MNTEEIYKHLKQQDSTIEFYKKQNSILEQQIEDIKNISNVVSDIPIFLEKEKYTKDEILDAYNKTLKHEGLSHRSGSLIIDTFIEFLNNTHTSLKK